MNTASPVLVSFELKNFNYTKPNGNGLTPNEVNDIGTVDYEIWMFYSQRYVITAEGDMILVVETSK